MRTKPNIAKYRALAALAIALLGAALVAPEANALPPSKSPASAFHGQTKRDVEKKKEAGRHCDTPKVKAKPAAKAKGRSRAPYNERKRGAPAFRRSR